MPNTASILKAEISRVASSQLATEKTDILSLPANYGFRVALGATETAVVLV
jgi:hypothetical protein